MTATTASTSGTSNQHLSYSTPENSLVMSETSSGNTSMQDVPISPMKLPKMRSAQHPRTILTPPPPLQEQPQQYSSTGSSSSQPQSPFDIDYNSDDDETVGLEHFQPLDMDTSLPKIEYCHDTDAEDYRGGPCQPSKKQDPREKFQVGDHVYQWRSWGGIPGVFQHHGIVMDIINDLHTGDFKLTIADFSNVATPSNKKLPNKKQQSGFFQEGILRTYTDASKWHKVEYQANWWKRTAYRAGTCTSSKSDAVGLVLARVNFIIQYPELLPDYHVIYANCECVAFWCKTGEWSTLQASTMLEMAAAGQAKQSATLALTAASAQVSVPASGVWGWMGYSSTVSWLSLHPMVAPALAGYAAVTIGTPAIIYYKAKGRWEETTKHLCDSFWESALEQPDVFAECMTHWSEKNIL
ncbi:unnamed protein product [Cylindrotheca closterium]|uniref:LRAT domain-containing protein n=1 Tax=Cylindrotheca closterium TaxID=2856 RepID=A0AAD2GCS9_9STRA|nr:unnamed protein product [Cylindrotheca closterium]